MHVVTLVFVIKWVAGNIIALQIVGKISLWLLGFVFSLLVVLNHSYHLWSLAVETVSLPVSHEIKLAALGKPTE